MFELPATSRDNLTVGIISPFARNEFQEFADRKMQGVTANEDEHDQTQNLFTRSFMINMATGRRNQVLKCKLCTMTSTKSFEMENHVRRHSRSRPFICNLCGFPFTTQGNKTRHQANASCFRNRRKVPTNDQDGMF